MKNIKIIIVAILVIIFSFALNFYLSFNKSPKIQVASAQKFAQCLGDSGARMYGAYWCPHCKRQKEVFGEASEEIPYIECAHQGTSEQDFRCKEARILRYPTWVFSDGKKVEGELTLLELSQKSGCKL